MAGKKMKDALLDCSEITSDIMSKINCELKENGIAFSHKNKSEIIIDGKTKKEIIEFIEGSGLITKNQMNLLLQVSESNGNVFIRQKFN